MVSVVDCVAAQVMSLGFNADFMWLNKLKTSEKGLPYFNGVLIRPSTYEMQKSYWLTYEMQKSYHFCGGKKSLRMPFFSSQNALFNGKTVAIRVKICIVSSGLHSWNKISPDFFDFAIIPFALLTRVQ